MSLHFYSLKTVYSPIKKDNSLFLLNFSIVSVGTNTFKHSVGYNNFAQRNDPLGWIIGSDSRELKFGLDWMYQNNLITKIKQFFLKSKIMEMSQKLVT